MTSLSYKIGNIEVTSFKMALELKKRTGLPIIKIYTPVDEEFKVDPVAREKRVAAIRRKALERAAR